MILKWVGGKRRLAPKIVEHFPDFVDEGINVYFEPFCGACSVYYELRRKLSKDKCPYAYLNDINEDLINFFRVLQDTPVTLAGECKKFKNNKEDYHKVRDDESNRDSLYLAARFYYINKCGYGGLYRVNSKGKINVPFGNYKKYEVNVELFVDAATAIKDATFISKSYGFFLLDRSLAGKVFLYLDPPYYNAYSGYTKGGFDMNSHIDLYRLCYELDRQGYMWVQTNTNHPFIRELYKKFNIFELDSRSSIGGKKKMIKELLIRNY